VFGPRGKKVRRSGPSGREWAGLLRGLALGEPGGPRGEGSGLAEEVVRAAGGLGLSGKGKKKGGGPTGFGIFFGLGFGFEFGFWVFFLFLFIFLSNANSNSNSRQMNSN